MSIKSKWGKLHFEGSNTYTWVFAEGKMFVISEAAHGKVKHDKFYKKTFYEGTIIKNEQRSAR